MWGITPFDTDDIVAKYKTVGRPKNIALDPPDPGWEAEFVKPIEVPVDLLSDTIYLGDFGLAIQMALL